jgi:signal transduction histidine kinase
MLLTREQLQERLIALHRASLELVRDVSLKHLLERIVATAREQSDATYAALGVLDDDGKLQQFITVGLGKEEISRIAHPPVGKGLIAELMDAEAPLRVPVIQDHPHSVGFPQNHPPMTSFLGVPIRAGTRQLGQIYLTDKIGAREFTSDDEKIIQMLAAYAAAAIQNARVHENTHRLAVLEERDRIGMDLHDGIIQSIYGIGLSLETVLLSLDGDAGEVKDRILEAIDGLNQTIRDLRAYILDLRPRKLGEAGLFIGIQRLVNEFRAHTFVDVQITGNDFDLKGVPESHSSALFHICQEALANAAKHAKAKTVQISLWMTGDRALMEIRDDGNGFDLDNMNLNIGHGLANMQTRAQAVGGDVEISSRTGEGTTVFAWVPRRDRS